MSLLEDVETECLRYLGKVSNPAVELDVLMAHLDDALGDVSLSRSEVEDFLEHHERIRVISAPGADERGGGPLRGPLVILADRIPERRELWTAMIRQLDTMWEALQRALGEARTAGDMNRVNEISDALARVERMREGVVRELRGE